MKQYLNNKLPEQKNKQKEKEREKYNDEQESGNSLDNINLLRTSGYDTDLGLNTSGMVFGQG